MWRIKGVLFLRLLSFTWSIWEKYVSSPHISLTGSYLLFCQNNGTICGNRNGMLVLSGQFAILCTGSPAVTV